MAIKYVGSIVIVLSILTGVTACENTNEAVDMNSTSFEEAALSSNEDIPRADSFADNAESTSEAEETVIESTSEPFVSADESEEISDSESVSKEELFPIDHMETNISDDSLFVLLQEIATIAAESSNVDVYYCDTRTGFYFHYNQSKTYPAASTLKAIYCQFLLQSGINLSEKIQFTSLLQSSTSGKLTDDKIGSYFTARELIEYAIIYSDNMAYRLLFDTYGSEEFNRYIQSLGLDIPRLSSSEYTKADAKSMAVCMMEIYRYSEATGDMFLINLMKNTTYNVQIGQGTQAEIAHKFGYEGDTYGYHDVAIVYADEPYVLSIFTNLDANVQGSNDTFAEIAAKVEILHTVLHTASE